MTEEKHNKCRICNGESFDEVLTIPDMPLGYPVPPEEIAEGNLWKRPLALRLCGNCRLGQTRYDVPSDKLAEENVYLSGSARAVLDHDDAFGSQFLGELGLAKDDLILEIGCGDGTLLNKIVDAGCRNVLGIDPSLHDDKSYAFETVRSFFDAESVARFQQEGKVPELIIANYVIELVPDIGRFFADVAALMKIGARFVVEVPSLVDFMQNRRIDGFVHLRCLWFTLHSLVHVYRSSGLMVERVDHLSDYRGGTLRVVGTKAEGEPELPAPIQRALAEEAKALSPEALAAFRNRIDEMRDSLRTRIDDLKGDGFAIYGYGGGHKACTLVNWLGITSEDMVASFDNDPGKQNRIIPGANIPVISPQEARSKGRGGKTAVVHMAIDHVAEVEEFMKAELEPGCRILHVLPDLQEIVD